MSTFDISHGDVSVLTNFWGVTMLMNGSVGMCGLNMVLSMQTSIFMLIYMSVTEFAE